MNRNHHRIVFNAARGQLMAVSETAAACTGSTATSEGPASALRPSRWHRAGAALLTTFATLNSQAQISADPSAPGNLRPTVLTAPNGVPLVNITTPSAAGVSRNVYRQFDVGTPGAILNNSRTNVQTQLGGWVQGNPWLATGPARVILNEVNSNQPSQLNGWVEVGGQRAEVVIANPAGIHVNGGGFINASRATLTTGTPVMNAGALEGFRVQGGQVKIEGLGLDASQSDHLAILARAIEVNAGLWAQALTVVAGVNDVSADISAITPLAATSAVGPTPTFALDVAALGGMYAGQIHLVGTEAGLGVNQAGLIDAQGTLTLDVNGWLSQSTGSRTYGDAVTINAQGVRNQNGAVVAARESLTIAAGEIHNTEGSLLLSAGNMALTASERIENRSASIEALGDLTISTPVLVNANDHFESTVVQGESTRFLRLVHNGVEYTSEEIGANFGPLNSYLDNPGFSILLPSSEFPFSEFPADITSWATRARFSVGGGGNSYGPIVGSAFAIAYSRSTKKDCRDCNWEVIDNYPADHGIWAKFGVASFGLMPAYTGQDCQDGAGGYCSPAQWTAYNTYQSALASYATRKELAQDQLDQKIASYNLSVGSRTLRDWTVIDGTATEYTPVVLASSPAQILAGGNLNVHARDSFVNDKSEVIAGGVLTTTLTAAGVGAAVGGAEGAASAATVDANNRQLHPTERKLAQDLANKSGGKYTAAQIEEQMRLMGNSAFHATPNSTEVLTTTGAIANNIAQDPGMPKTTDGKVVVEVPGQANAAIQQYIIGNSTDGSNYIPGQSPYLTSNTALNPRSTAYSPGNTPATAACANSDLACKSGVGAQQSTVPDLTKAAREGIADTAATTSRQAGVIAAGATAVAAGTSPPIKPIAASVAVGATAIGVAADAIEQVVRPDVGQIATGSGALILQTLTEQTLTGRAVAPITNELMEAWKASGSALAVEDWVNNHLRK